MDKQQEAAQTDSISTVGVPIKEYPPSEVYSSEPPPAYVRPRGTAVQIARIAAITLVAVSFILGFFMVASAYVSASVSCYQEYPVTQENIEDRPTYQHLVDPLDSEETSDNKRESVLPPASASQTQQQNDEQPIRVNLPLQLDFDELAGSLIEKNQRSRMNCVVEKRRAEEVMDHQPKTVRLPFGVNLTTDPRYEHITGERMAIFCESGNDQRPKMTVRKDIWDKGTHMHKERTYYGHVPMDQQVPMMIPIHVQQIPVPHPNAIPHHMPPHHIPQMPHPMAHQMFQQPHPQMHPQMPQGMPHHQMPHPMHQQMPHQMTHQQMPHPQMPHPQMQQMPQIQQIQRLEQIPQMQQVSSEGEPIHIKFPSQIPLEEGDQVIIHEQVIPMYPRPEGRSLEHHPVEVIEQHPVPSDTVKPPPPPAFARLPVQDRPHFVQPRSVRSVDSLLRREKRVRRCACDCAC